MPRKKRYIETASADELKELRKLTGFSSFPPSADEREVAAERTRKRMGALDAQIASSAERRDRLARFVKEHEVSRLLHDARKKAHFTQQQLAECLGTTQSQITRIESGRRNMTLATLERYAQACGYEVEFRLRPV